MVYTRTTTCSAMMSVNRVKFIRGNIDKRISMFNIYISIDSLEETCCYSYFMTAVNTDCLQIYIQYVLATSFGMPSFRRNKNIFQQLHRRDYGKTISMAFTYIQIYISILISLVCTRWFVISRNIRFLL